jgi:hypothetical protein
MFIGMMSAAFAQTTVEVYASSFARWNYSTKKWMWEDPESTNMTIVINTKVIRVNDQAESAYFIVKNSMEETMPNGSIHIGWDVIDEKGRKAFYKFVLNKNTGKIQHYVIYDDVAYCYHIRSK